MKKILMLAACTAAMTAITSCSSNDDDVLPQATVAPAAGESVAETGGIPFSVTAFENEDSRAIRYGADGTGIDYKNAKAVKTVTEFKLYGRVGTSDPWIPSYVFSRADADSPWEPNRDNDAVALNNKIQWGDTENATTFYAITDNDLGTTSGNKLENVIEYFSNTKEENPDGYIKYEIPTKTVSATEGDAEISSSHIGRSGDETGWVTDEWDSNLSSFEGVDSTSLRDLMAAYATKAPSSTDATISLPFKHILAGLSVKVKFPSHAWYDNGESCRIYGIRIHGLKTAGKYYFNDGTWELLDGNDVSYYKTFGIGTTAGQNVPAEEPTTDPKDATKYDLVYPGEWLIIPQTVTAAVPSGTGFPATGAYAEILFYSYQEYGVGYIPFSLSNIEAGNNYTLVLNITKLRETVNGELFFNESIFE